MGTKLSLGDEAFRPHAGRTSRAGFPVRLDPPSAIDRPENDAEHQAQQEARDDRKIERHVVALDDDIAGQPAEPDPAEVRPEQADPRMTRPSMIKKRIIAVDPSDVPFSVPCRGVNGSSP